MRFASVRRNHTTGIALDTYLIRDYSRSKSGISQRPPTFIGAEFARGIKPPAAEAVAEEIGETMVREGTSGS